MLLNLPPTFTAPIPENELEAYLVFEVRQTIISLRSRTEFVSAR